MFRRQRSGAVVCPSCGRLVGVSDDRCLNCGRRNPGMWGLTGMVRGLGRDMGFVQLVMGGTILLYGAMLAWDVQGIRGGGSLFSLLSPSPASLLAFGASGALPVFGYGHWWTVLSAGWLHAGLLHILFNLLWVRQLAPETAELYGPGRMVIIYTAGSVVGFALSSVMGAVGLGGARLSVGASAPLFALLAALVYYGRRSGSKTVGRQAWTWAIALFVLAFVMGGGVDNWAHAGGFAGGYVASKLLDPLREERGDHVLAGIACLAATGLSVAASLVTFYLQIRPALGR